MRHLNHWSQRVVGKLFSAVYMNGGRFACFNQTREETRRPTSASRRTGFDWTLFQVMLEDRERLVAYRRDIERSVSNARVLEIGPGPEAVLSIMCLAAGARSLTTVEGDPWVAGEAALALKRQHDFGPRWKLVQKLSTELSAADVGNDLAFDVLVCEIYDSIACREQVAETIQDLKSRGFSFDRVISRGFETWVAPSAAPPAAKMSRIERLALGWGWSGMDAAQRSLDTQRSTLHGDHELIAKLCLAAPQCWQQCDFEADGHVTTAANLRFSIDEPARQKGFLFWNRFLFHDGQSLNTLASPTNWGVTFVPLRADRQSRERQIELLTHVPNPGQPSSFTLQANSAAQAPESVHF